MANDPTPPRSRSTPPSETDVRRESGLQRRDFLKVAGAGASLFFLGGCAPSEDPAVPGIRRSQHVPFVGRSSADIVVIGAGAWGGWTALNLRQMGAKVTLVDAYGPGNGRSTSGDESRGVRSSYGDRSTGEHWMLWAREAMKRWAAFDDDVGPRHATRPVSHHGRFDHARRLGNVSRQQRRYGGTSTTSRIRRSKSEDVRKEFPVISMDDMNIVLYEPDAGVVRARRACQAVPARSSDRAARSSSARAARRR